MGENGPKRRVLNRWAALAAGVIVLGWAGWFVALVVVELATERALEKSITLQVANDGRPGSTWTMGGLFDQIASQVEPEVNVDFGALGLDRSTWRQKSLEDGGAIAPMGGGMSMIFAVAGSRSASGGGSSPAGATGSAGGAVIGVAGPSTNASMKMTIPLDADYLNGMAQHWLSPDAVVVIEGRTVIVTHKDRVGFDATGKARAAWKWITSR